MNKKLTKSIFSSTNSLKVLSFLAKNPGQEFLSSEIQHATSISRAGAYLALQDLLRKRLIIRTEKGRFHLYTVNYENPTVRQFKVLLNTLLLEPIISKMQPLAVRIILFGSASRGEDIYSSDMDLFILSKDPEKTKELCSSFKSDRRIQPIILSPAEMPDFRDSEKTFFDEIEKGIVLWEEKE
jgi:predicted nucleotidyltransferase